MFCIEYFYFKVHFPDYTWTVWQCRTLTCDRIVFQCASSTRVQHIHTNIGLQWMCVNTKSAAVPGFICLFSGKEREGTVSLKISPVSFRSTSGLKTYVQQTQHSLVIYHKLQIKIWCQFIIQIQSKKTQNAHFILRSLKTWKLTITLITWAHLISEINTKYENNKKYGL